MVSGFMAAASVFSGMIHPVPYYRVKGYFGGTKKWKAITGHGHSQEAVM